MVELAVIQAGGEGTRLRELTKDKIPKPLLAINGKPMIEWQIENVRKYGVREFIIIVGHLGERIKEYFRDGARWGVNISYIEETEPLGSAGALYYLKERVAEKNFLLIFGDVLFDVDLRRMAHLHEKRRSLATLAVHPNKHPYDSDLVVMDESGRLMGFDAKTNKRDYWYANLVNAGLYILSGELLAGIDAPRKLDLEKGLFVPNIAVHGNEIVKGRIFGYRTTEYIKDAGTPERFAEVCEEQRDGLWERRNLSQKQRCIFLDRDGTLNVYKGLLADVDAFELEKNVAEGVRLINKSGFLAIVVTNQSVVARGMCSISDVHKIHAKMETLLGRQGAYLDDIAFCPHHQDKGFPEENPKYKISCTCRKPGTGMIDKMAEKYHIDLSRSYMVGDSTVDVQTGINAGLRTVLVQTGRAGMDWKYAVKADFEAADVLAAVMGILEEEGGKGNG